MNCPACQQSMAIALGEDREIDRCSACGGLFFTMSERSRAKVATMPPARQSIACPRCASPMHEVADQRRPHVRYFACGSCAGTFLDAGEMRAMGGPALVDQIVARLSQA